MPDDVIPNPEGTTTEPVPTGAVTDVIPPATPTPSTPPDQDWKKAYKGLQRNYDKIVKELADLQSENDNLTATNEEQKQTLRKATTEKDQITSKNVEATETISGLEAQVNVAKAQSERSTLIMSEFIDLAQFEAKGLLPEAQNPEEMRSKFGEFRDALGETVQTGVDAKLKGIGPGPTDPATPEPLDADQIYNRMTALAGTKDPEERREYNMLSKQWLAIQEEPPQE
jgi:hypothetical protein